MPLTPVEDALTQLLDTVQPLPSETIPLEEAHNRVLAEDSKAKLNQPPFDASAMDGYAIRHEDLSETPVRLKIICESAAGHGFQGRVESGQAVRVFTGAPVPEGADTVVIQENTKQDGAQVFLLEPATKGEHIRPKGCDFFEGEILLKAGKILNFRDIALAAAMNHASLSVFRKPVVAILATGDELVSPGETPNPDQIISSIPYGLKPMIESAGASAMMLGIAKDTLQSLDEKLEQAKQADVLVTIGGASVGDHDLVQQALKARGMELHFWKVAMRPGKPVFSGQLHHTHGQKTHVLGLPGNPVSALISSRIFLLPLLQKLAGREVQAEKTFRASLAEPLPENGPRQHYMRGVILDRKLPKLLVKAMPSQDSSLLKILAQSDCLIIRKPNAPAILAGEEVDIFLFDLFIGS